MCLLDVPKHSWDGPQTAEVMAIETGKVTIRWYKGGLYGVVCLYVLKDATNKKIGKGKDWEETVNIKQIWCNGFQLTESHHFPAEIKRSILDYY